LFLCLSVFLVILVVVVFVCIVFVLALAATRIGKVSRRANHPRWVAFPTTRTA
jgi:Mn2+/Fe2+ NRAMP family transporter